jgi:serine phosphatase RsbU (regulator of sigma subunit)/PAS domain-containing protein
MTPFPMRVHQTFAAAERSVAEARRFTRQTLQEWGAVDLVDSASLIVSELVTNALVHTGTPALVTLTLHGPDLRIDVEDRHPGRIIPIVTIPTPDTSEHGRGMVITRSLSSAWGVEYTAAMKRVWALCRSDGGSEAAHVAPVDVPPPEGGSEVAVVEISPAGDVTGWHGDATSLFGWTADEVVGLPYGGLLDRVEGGGRPEEVTSPRWSGRWQGTYAVVRKDGTRASVFASHARATAGGETTALVVAAAGRALLEVSVPSAQVRPETSDLGLRDDALVILGVEEYLARAAERARDPISAVATYVLLVRDFDDELEVAAVSGLPVTLLGTRLAPGARGTPDMRNPHLPVVIPDLAELEVPLLERWKLRSLVVVPLVVEGTIVGALAAASDVVDGFDDAQAAWLQRFADSIALTADRARLKASERERRGWLNFLADAGDLLAGSLDQGMTMAITSQIVVPRIAGWCAIHLSDERGKPVLEQIWHEDENELGRLRAAAEAISRQQLEGDDPVVLGSATTSIPLLTRGRQIGYLTIGRPRRDLQRSEFFLVVESIARRAALAIDNARAHGDLQAVGRALQESLLPPSAPTAPGLDVGVVYEPAGEESVVGGDFYDLFPLGNGKWCFVVGDVCGTGAEAAAVTGLARHTIHALTRAGFPIAATLERLNDAILDEGPRARFLTLVCGTLQLEGGQVRLDLVNAGHPPPFLATEDGRIREIGRPQTLLGVVEHETYASESHVLSRGDLLVTVTDGVLERRDGARMLGDEGVAEALTHTGQMPAQAIAERIRRLVVDFADTPQQDDMAIVAIRIEMGAALA